MKGVILAGGFGTRLHPFTKVSNKHLAPIYSQDGAQPMIFSPIRTLRESGVTEILIITSRDHCGHMVQTLGDGEDLGVTLTYKIQEMDRKPTGIAQALKLSENFVGDSNFAVILGDNYYEETFKEEFEMFEKYGPGHATIFLKEVKDPHRFGVASVSDGIGGYVDSTRSFKMVTKIVEKPETPETNFAVTGLYLYTSDVFQILPTLTPSRRGELEITDVNNHYVNKGTVTSFLLNGFWSDMGTPESMMRTQAFLNGEHK